MVDVSGGNYWHLARYSSTQIGYDQRLQSQGAQEPELDIDSEKSAFSPEERSVRTMSSSILTQSTRLNPFEVLLSDILA